MKNKGTLRVYDTSALLSFSDTLKLDSESYVSAIVIAELENIKTSLKNDDVKYNARKVVNLLRHSECNTFVDGKPHIDRLAKKYGKYLDLSKNDSYIILETEWLSESGYDVIFHTGDYAQYLLISKLFPNIESHIIGEQTKERFWDGYKRVEPTEEQWDKIRDVTCEENMFDLVANEYVIFHDNDGKESIARWDEDEKCLTQPGWKTIKNTWLGTVKPRNIEQEVYLDLLQNDSIKIVSCFSGAGQGKTFLALAAGLDMVMHGVYDKVIYIRNNFEIENTKEIGFLSGDLDEKTNWLTMPIADCVGGQEALDVLKEQGIFAYEHLSFLRGRNLGPRYFVICDESQNMTPELMKTVISRFGEGTKGIFLGDYAQIDDNRLFANSRNGMLALNRCLKGNKLYGQVRLKKVERSEISELAAMIK